MKRTLLFIATAFCALAVNAQKANTMKMTGKLITDDPTVIILCNQPKSTKFDTLKVAKNGSFSYVFEDVDSVCNRIFHVVTDSGKAASNVRLQAVPGKSVNLELKVRKGEYEHLAMMMNGTIVDKKFKGTNAVESQFLNLNPHLLYNYRRADSTVISYKEFVQQINEYQDRLRPMLKGANQKFYDNMMKQIDKASSDLPCLYAVNVSRMGVNPVDDADFMQEMLNIDLNSLEQANDFGFNFVLGNLNIFPLGKVGESINYRLQKDSLYHKGESQYERFLHYVDENVINVRVRHMLANMIISHEMRMGGTDHLKPVFAIYKKLAEDTPDYASNEKTYNSLVQLVVGKKASDFDMKDVNGNPVRFHDVIGKGKAVYIDFWATWCHPCCAEIPHVEKLVEHFKNDPRIEMVSISLDNNEKAWLKKLENDKPIWRQYIIPDNFNSTFAAEYNVHSIPRFMMFDKDGGIININAPRPSAPEIIEWIESQLK